MCLGLSTFFTGPEFESSKCLLLCPEFSKRPVLCLEFAKCPGQWFSKCPVLCPEFSKRPILFTEISKRQVLYPEFSKRPVFCLEFVNFSETGWHRSLKKKNTKRYIVRTTVRYINMQFKRLKNSIPTPTIQTLQGELPKSFFLSTTHPLPHRTATEPCFSAQ